MEDLCRVPTILVNFFLLHSLVVYQEELLERA